jgi:hypothetical protein
MILRSLAAVVVVALAALFGYRLVQIDRRLDSLEKRLGAPSRDSDQKVSDSKPPPLEERLSELERRADQESVSLGALELAATHVAPPTRAQQQKADDKAILSVVEREANKVRDAQLDWQKGHWIDAREGQLAAFTRQGNLTQSQTEQLRTAFTKEIDSMVDLLKRPALATDPDEAIKEWREVLEETDAEAAHILNPAQMTIWQQERFIERKILWPWIPD